MQRTGDRITVSGRLTLDTAREAAGTLFGSDRLPHKGEKITVDLQQVEAVDSAAVSVLLQWSRLAQNNDVQLSFINLPANLRSLVNLYDVAEMLSVS